MAFQQWIEVSVMSHHVSNHNWPVFSTCGLFFFQFQLNDKQNLITSIFHSWCKNGKMSNQKQCFQIAVTWTFPAPPSLSLLASLFLSLSPSPCWLFICDFVVYHPSMSSGTSKIQCNVKFGVTPNSWCRRLLCLLVNLVFCWNFSAKRNYLVPNESNKLMPVDSSFSICTCTLAWA